MTIATAPEDHHASKEWVRPDEDSYAVCIDTQIEQWALDNGSQIEVMLESQDRRQGKVTIDFNCPAAFIETKLPTDPNMIFLTLKIISPTGEVLS